MPVLRFKVTEAEARAMRAKSLSAFLRTSVLGEEPPKAKVIRAIHPISGLPYDAAPGRIVTDEGIRAALVDFP